jgi:hypothetical protein
VQTYHILRNGKQSGPFSIHEVKTMLTSGELASNNLYWVEGMSEWETLDKAFETPAAARPSPLPPPPLKANAFLTKQAQQTEDDRWKWGSFVLFVAVTGIIKLVFMLFR